MHRSFGTGRLLDRDRAAATQRLTVSDDGCPLKFDPTPDGGHTAMCVVLKLLGKVPRKI